MSLANRGTDYDEMCLILEALLSQGRDTRPDQDMDVWEQRMKMIPDFASSAIKKISNEKLTSGKLLNPEVFMDISLSGAKLLRTNIGELDYLLEPKYLQAPSITMIHAVRGLGKTFFSLSLGMALATGADFLKWKMTRKKGIKVAYIDGEMPLKAIQNHMRTLSKSFAISKEEARSPASFVI